MSRFSSIPKSKLIPLRLTTKRLISYSYDKLSIPKNYVLSPEVKEGLKNDLPIVGLESTIITHSMPYPENLKLAKSLIDNVKSNSCIPCTIAIIDNKVHFGLNDELLEKVAKTATKATKVSRRDIVHILAKGGVGSTTIGGTLALASQINLKLMVAGGLGGVHKDGQNNLDISADLLELGKQNMAVVCSGVKSILDIGLTLEVLETQGVSVITYSKTSDYFPAFFTEKSKFKSPIHMDNLNDIAKFLNTASQVKLGSGTLIAVPVPRINNGNEEVDFDNIIDKAINMSIKDNIHGKGVTPYLLDKVIELSNGKSLETNIRLAKNNADVGSKLLYQTFNLNQ